MGQARPLTVQVGYRVTRSLTMHDAQHSYSLRVRPSSTSAFTVVTRPYDWDDTSHSHRSQPRIRPLSLSYHTHMVESFRTCCRWFNLCTAVYMNTRHVLRVSSLRMSVWDFAKYFLNLQRSYCSVSICAEFEEEIGIRNREAGSARGSVDINFPVYMYEYALQLGIVIRNCSNIKQPPKPYQTHATSQKR